MDKSIRKAIKINKRLRIDIPFVWYVYNVYEMDGATASASGQFSQAGILKMAC